MRLVQFLTSEGSRRVALVSEDGNTLHVLQGIQRVYDLAMAAIAGQGSLEQLVESQAQETTVDYEQVIVEKRLLPPLDHPDPAHCLISGTGLTHLGSAQSRNSMHEQLNADESTLTDSMKMFKLGVEGGKPEPGQIGSAPEWFYKGDGSWVVAPEQSLELPSFALDGGEEAEIAGLYLIGPAGEPYRVGYALGNEFSDHVIEKQNYLYLAHSKLRNCVFGPELLIGNLPDHIEGTVKVIRNNKTIWSDTFLTGEANMSHTIGNLEHHHFKYASFRRPGDVHCHFYGAAVLSFAASIVPQAGDIFEISAPQFGRPLRNSLVASQSENTLVQVQAL